MGWRILEGDARERLAELPDRSAQTCITSPPYLGLRDYGHDGQIGLEATPDEFVAALVDVFREVRRVLRDDGTVWLNLGDSYAGSWGAQSREATSALADRSVSAQQIAAHPKRTRTGSIPAAAEYKPKDLLGIPWMVAFALRADGWYLRSDVIWSKPNPMPESVSDRPTKAHEYLFLLSKGPRYFYDADGIRETAVVHDRPEGIIKAGGEYETLAGRNDGDWPRSTTRGFGADEAGRNKRSVWTVATQPYADAHFATFPPKLIEPCVLAGTSPQACGICGASWERVTERTPMVVRPSEKRAAWQAVDDHARTQVGGTMTEPPSTRTTGWRSTCEHDDDTGSCVVLDPFAGAGTTGVVALRRDRSFVGIELNPEYAEMARARIRDDGPLFNVESELAA